MEMDHASQVGQQKLYATKKLFLDLNTKSSSKDDRSSSTKHPTTEVGELSGFENEMINIFNIDVTLKNVEKQFYKKRSRYSEKVMFFGSKKKKRLSKNIMKTFIKDSSPLQINISYEAKTGLLDNYKSNPNWSNLFTDAKEEILNLMLRNSYPIFLESPFFYEMELAEKKINPESYMNVGKEDDNSSSDNTNQVDKDTIELKETSNRNETDTSSSSSTNSDSNSDSDFNYGSNSNSKADSNVD
ncbi:regulator of g protein signaling [Anaeramoeba flamelloides]|uniref:Regulator of g protein signaling n=1 Tax=Anaeramoeba flamelloides TaxID=1746091 RepID=A0AAV7YMG8_9EUKA|nr:regulator of g protein signaling [Anaeramoeba flamelloides]